MVDPPNMSITHTLIQEGSTSSHRLKGKISLSTNCSSSEITEDIRLVTLFGSEDLPRYVSFDNSTMEILITT